jgi:hypothetical protein
MLNHRSLWLRTLRFQVRLVRITEMVHDAYYSRLYLAKVTALPSKLCRKNNPFSLYWSEKRKHGNMTPGWE